MPGDCPDCALPSGLTRRQTLRVGALALATAVGLAPGPQVVWAAAVQHEVAPGLVVRPRQAWAGDRAPTGSMQVEAPGDVRFLLVHHTASTNSYGIDDVADQLRGFFGYHTSADKGWPDIAYNVLVDRYGGVWEGRQGSLSAPVMPDATGGSQGFAQLACFIGDLGAEPPTPEARASMLRVLAWLADRFTVDTSPGATATFVSRGSNRHSAGTTVTTATIAGHRDMSVTSCPGDLVYGQVRDSFPAEVTQLRTPVVPPPAEPVAPVSPRESPSPSQSAGGTAGQSQTPGPSRAPSLSPSSTTSSPARLSAPTPTPTAIGVTPSDAGATSPPGSSDARTLAVGAAAGAVVAASAAGLLGRHRRIRGRSAGDPSRAGSTPYDGSTEVGTHSDAPLDEEGRR